MRLGEEFFPSLPHHISFDVSWARAISPSPSNLQTNHHEACRIQQLPKFLRNDCEKYIVHPSSVHTLSQIISSQHAYPSSNAVTSGGWMRGGVCVCMQSPGGRICSGRETGQSLNWPTNTKTPASARKRPASCRACSPPGMTVFASQFLRWSDTRTISEQ